MDVLRLKTFDAVLSGKLFIRGSSRDGGLHSLPRIGLISSGDATSIFHTSLDWHLLEAIVTCWDLALGCITIKDVDLVFTLEEYDRFLSLPTSMSRVYRPLTRSRFHKWLAEFLGLKTPVVDVLTQYRSGLGVSIPFDFLFC